MASTRYYADFEDGGAGVIYWKFTRGDTAVQQFTVKNLATGAVVDITAWTAFRFTAKDRYTDADNQAVLAETLSGGGIVKTTAASGLCTITIAAADTASLSFEQYGLVADLQGTDGSGNTWTLARGGEGIGGVFIQPDASRTNP